MTTSELSHAEALRWAEAHLRGSAPGPVRVEPMKTRPWAATWRLSTAERVAYLKAASVTTRYEVPLMTVLSQAAPSSIPPVLAAEPDRGWLLLADAGTTVRDHLGGRFDAADWQGMLERFGQLQRAVEPLIGDLLRAGVPDERPARNVEMFERLLADAPGLTDEQRYRLGQDPIRCRDAATALGELAIPASIQHGDLHDGNVGIGRDNLIRFFDFGDASVAHPFTTLLIPLRLARNHGADDQEIFRLQDVYLSVFTDLADPSELREALDLALRTAPLLRMTSWQRALIEAPADHGWGDPIGDWLKEIVPV